MPDDIQQAVLRSQWATEGKRMTGMYRLTGSGPGENGMCYVLEYAKQLEDQIYHSKPKGWWARLWGSK